MRFIVNHIINAASFRNLMVFRILPLSDKWQKSDFDDFFLYISKIQIHIIRPPSKTLTCFPLDARFLSYCINHQRDARHFFQKSFLCRRYVIVFPLLRDVSFRCIYRKRDTIFFLTPNTQIFDWKKTRA